MEEIVNGKTYQIIKLLGKGKGGYSYLASFNNDFFVLKKIHHEPCSYYQFGNKIEAEFNDYTRLLNAKINIPKMIDIDKDKEIIIKEYIEGKTIFEMVKNDEDISLYIKQVKDMERLARESHLNIDYFPTNFIPRDNILYYIDYECNEYSDTWNFDNWGKEYWSKTQKFMEYLNSQK